MEPRVFELKNTPAAPAVEEKKFLESNLVRLCNIILYYFLIYQNYFLVMFSKFSEFRLCRDENFTAFLVNFLMFEASAIVWKTNRFRLSIFFGAWLIFVDYRTVIDYENRFFFQTKLVEKKVRKHSRDLLPIIKPFILYSW